MSEKLVIIEIGNPQSLIQRENSPTSELINTEKLFYKYFENHGFLACSNNPNLMIKNIVKEDAISFTAYVRLLNDLKKICFYVGDLGYLLIDSVELFETQDWNKVIHVLNLLSS